MPFLLVIVGLTMIVTGVKNTSAQFGQQLVGDFTGSGNFTYWLVAIGSVGALGYVPDFKQFSRVFLALIIIAMVLRNGGVFSQLTAALQQGPQEAQPAASSSDSSSSNASGIDEGFSALGAAATSTNTAGTNARANFASVVKALPAIVGAF